MTATEATSFATGPVGVALEYKVPPFAYSTPIAPSEGDTTRRGTLTSPAHKDFSAFYEKMSGKGESASEAHLDVVKSALTCCQLKTPCF